MTTVKIDSPGVTVELSGEEPLEVVERAALRLFREAGGWPQAARLGSVGFAVMERHDADAGISSTMPEPVETPR